MSKLSVSVSLEEGRKVSIKEIVYQGLGIYLLPSRTCPKCGSVHIIHIHHTLSDRVLSIFVPRMRRYACLDAECDWEGRVKYTDF